MEAGKGRSRAIHQRSNSKRGTVQETLIVLREEWHEAVAVMDSLTNPGIYVARAAVLVE
jgi:hypothetical protein